MKAAVLHGPRDLRIESATVPAPAPGEVLVRVKAAGLCGTDYRIWSGDRPVRYPLIMGHEFIGEVAAVGAGVTHLMPGDRVAVEPNYSCGSCALCREGNRNLCAKRTAVGIDVSGGFAQFARLPARCCWLAPAGLTEEQLLLTEPLAVMVRAVARAEVKPGATAAVVGAGTLGLLGLQVLRARGARVLVVGRTDRRLSLARQLGAEAVHALAAGPGSEAARAFSGREGVDVVVETAGTPEAVAGAIELARPGGRVVLTGLPHEPSQVHFFWVVRHELTLVGSMIYQDEFPEAMRLLHDGAVTVAPLVTHRFPLDAIGDAFVAYRQPDSIKIAVIP
ncbi:MAG: alcohol dehydrogenase catalytic domain-containing protein [Candidatus Rokubacteria bacterium]|nr:alcohol dehydrogenase catalytic domain-containing protein [Candidatus Rokubacteria bacterium]